MRATSEDLKTNIRARLALGDTPTQIAEELDGATYSVALGLHNAMRKEEQKNKVKDLAAIDPVALDVLVSKAKAEAPPAIAAKIEAVAEGLTGIQLLDTQFHTTMNKVLERANGYLDEKDLKPSEWVMITNAVANAYNQIFNSKGVNVNVNNNTQINSNKLSMFKGSLRG